MQTWPADWMEHSRKRSQEALLMTRQEKYLPKLQLADLELPSPIDVNLEATGKVYTVVQLPRKLKNITMPAENYRVVLVVNESSSRVSTTLYPVHRTMSICDVFDLSEVKDMLQDKMKNYSKDVTTDDKNIRYRGLVEDAKRQTTAGRVDKDKRQRYLAEKGVIVRNEGIVK